MGWKFELKKYVFAVLLAGFIFLALSLYIFFRRGYYTLYIANKAFAGDAALLLAIVFLLGPFSRFFNVFDRFLQYRKEIGILAFFLGLVHGVVSFFFLPNYFPQARFLTGLNWSFIYGLIGLVLLILVYLISNKRAEVFLAMKNGGKCRTGAYA